MDFFAKGGWMIYAIMACSLMAVSIAAERWMFFKKNKLQKSDKLSLLQRALAEGNQVRFDAVLNNEAAFFEKRLYLLATLGTIAPLLGLLGTVFGMIKTFHAASLTGAANPGMLAEGIAEALYNTAAGLCVTVFSIIAHNHYRQSAEEAVHELELQAHLGLGGQNECVAGEKRVKFHYR